MTSKDRVLTAFEHNEPDRVPRWCGASPEFWNKCKNELELNDEGLRIRFGDDFRQVSARYCGPIFPQSPGSTYQTPFGIDRLGIGYGQPLNHPLANASLSEVHEYAWPDPSWMFVSEIREEASMYKGQYAILGGEWSPFWHDAIDLIGMENLCYKMYDEPEIVDAVLEHIVNYYIDFTIQLS